MESNKINIDHFTYGEKLKEWAKKYSDNIAIIDEEIKVTYSEMYEKVQILTKHLLRMGIEYNDKVILQFPNTYIFAFTFLSLLNIGAKPILVLPAHREKDIEGIIEKTNAKAYFCNKTYLNFNYEELATNLSNKHKSIKYCIFDDEIKEMLNNDIDYSKPYRKPTYDEVGLYILSGGTTGIPKLIPRTHGDYIYNGRKFGERCKLTEKDIYLAIIPVEHNFALNNPGILGTFEYGGTNVFSLYASPMEVLELIEKYKVTHTSLVPALAMMCVEYLKWDDSFDLSSLKFIGIGGAALTPIAAKKIKEGFGCKLLQVFGTGEGLICTTDLEDSDEIVFNCQGKPISEFDQIKIVDSNYEEVPLGEIGELINKGPYTIKAYYKNEDANKKSFTSDGYYCTGDLACITKEGNIRVVGRIKEQINRAGEKIMPSEIEEHINKYPGIVDNVLLGVPDELLGNSTCACVINRSEKMNIMSLRNFLKEMGLAEYKRPDKLVQFDAFPLTAVNKVDRNRLLEMVIEKLKEEK